MPVTIGSSHVETVRQTSATHLYPEVRTDALRLLSVVLPDWSATRINEAARAGRIPGAVKVGRSWMIRESAVDALVTGTKRPVPTVEEALADLQRRGVV